MKPKKIPNSIILPINEYDDRIRVMALVSACKNIKELKLIINLVKRTEYDHLFKDIEIKQRNPKRKRRKYRK